MGIQSKEESEWPILLISMGSVHSLPPKIIRKMYEILNVHSLQNRYRVLWALRQPVFENASNEDLQSEHFRILPYLPQLELLQHSAIRLFLTHCGEGGIAESI